MDKSFNDQELSDIMKEIEALEEEFSTEAESSPIEATSVMEELAEMELDQAVPSTNTKETILAFEKKEVPAPTAPAAKAGTQSSMSFKVQGDMNLELSFEIGGKTIHLEVTEAGLSVHMEGGVTFSVPVSDAHSVKKAV
jgi:hypothetical protein